MAFINIPSTSPFKTALNLKKVSVVQFSNTPANAQLIIALVDGSERVIPVPQSASHSDVNDFINKTVASGFIKNTIDNDLPILQCINLNNILSSTEVNETENLSVEGGFAMFQIEDPEVVQLVRDFIEYN